MSNLTFVMTRILSIRTGNIHAIAEWRRHRRDRRLLESMTDGELRDMGIDRGQIGHVLARGRYDFAR